MIYLWLKAGHVIFVIFWMAGLFMLPRYFVYHQETAPGSPEAAANLSAALEAGVGYVALVASDKRGAAVRDSLDVPDALREFGAPERVER